MRLPRRSRARVEAVIDAELRETNEAALVLAQAWLEARQKGE